METYERTEADPKFILFPGAIEMLKKFVKNGVPGANQQLELSTKEALVGALKQAAKIHGEEMMARAEDMADAFLEHLTQEAEAKEIKEIKQEIFDTADQMLAEKPVDGSNSDNYKPYLARAATRVKKARALAVGSVMTEKSLARWAAMGEGLSLMFARYRDEKESAKMSAEHVEAKRKEIPKEYPKLYAAYPKLAAKLEGIQQRKRGYRGKAGESGTTDVATTIGPAFSSFKDPKSVGDDVAEYLRLEMATKAINDEIEALEKPVGIGNISHEEVDSIEKELKRTYL